VQDDVDQGVELGDGVARGFDLGRTHVLHTMDDLPLQVAQVHRVIINYAQGAHSGGGQVQQCRGTQPAGAYDEDFGILKPALAQGTNFRNDEMPGVPLHLGWREFGGRFNEGRKDSGRSSAGSNN
jgi:hypothetical protein